MRGLFAYPVFISYSSKDEAWVGQLARALEGEFEVFFARRSIPAGDNWRTHIERALGRSTAGIVVLSPDAVASPAVNAEITVLLSRLWEQGRPLVPVWHKAVEPPPLLKALQGVDFRGREPDDAAALQELRAALRGRTGGLHPSWRRGWVSLRLTFVLLVLAACLPTIALGAREFIGRRGTLARLRQVQREVQGLEESIGQAARPNVPYAGSQEYRDPSGRRSVTDTWNDGRLLYRSYYVGGRLLARDNFTYDHGMVVGKLRQYMDREQRVFLEDRFTQDGLLSEKRHCRQGPERPADVYVDDMRSPLPPPQIIFYR